MCLILFKEMKIIYKVLLVYVNAQLWLLILITIIVVES